MSTNKLSMKDKIALGIVLAITGFHLIGCIHYFARSVFFVIAGSFLKNL